MMREVLQPTAAVAELVKEFFGPHYRLLLSIIDEFVPAETPQQRRNMIAFSIVGQCLHYRVGRPIMNLLLGPEQSTTLTPQRIADHVADFSLAALGNISGHAGGARPAPTHP